MPTLQCRDCQTLFEIPAPSAAAPAECPRCGGQCDPVSGAAGSWDAALDDLVSRPGVRTFCNVMSSVVVHAGLLSLIALATWTGSQMFREEEAEASVPVNAVLQNAPNEGSGFRFQNPQVTDRDVENTGKSEGLASSAARPAETAEPAGAVDNLRGLAMASSDRKAAGFGDAAAGANPAGLLGRAGTLGGPGGGRAGGGNGTGLRGQRGGGPFFGHDAVPGARSIVYVVDRSGSMDPVGDFLKVELSRAVNQLQSTQRFNVIWFSEGDPYVLANNLVAATEENKARLFRHLTDVKLQGSTDPRSALFRALDLKPDLIYVLTDGNFEPEFVEQVTRRNAGKTRINCVGFVIGGEGHTNLKRLAEGNRGRFREVEVRNLTGQ
jgi:hypothetical protein